jgi:SAM-dependent methyltransferase
MKTQDCFNWDSYTESHYENEMSMLTEKYNLDLIIDNFDLENEEIVFKNNLHNNWMELYHQIHKLKVNSVYECGCGCAHHLINIYKIDNTIDIGGCDYSQNQIDLGKKYFNLDSYPFKENLKVIDLTNDLYEIDKTYEFVFTQAVVMHLSYDRAKKFLSNIKKITNKYIFLIENQRNHDFNQLLSESLPEFEKIELDKKYIDYAILLKRKSP